MNTFGNLVKISIFGESHGPGIGAVLDGLPPGEAIDGEEIQYQMDRRAPGKNSISTPRWEPDRVKILSGLLDGRTTGAPICGFLKNTDTRSGDYTPHLPRPGHADLAARLKYDGYSDYRGGGHFSGRITAALVFAGALCRQILARRGVSVGAHIETIKNVSDDRFNSPTAAELHTLSHCDFPLLNANLRGPMEDIILKAREAGDSVGGVIECGAVGLPAGLGSPFFGGLESAISAMMYAIPAVKGVEFGAGFDIVNMTGSQANDPIRSEGGRYYTETNHNGGINGGITNGMPLIFRVAVKPTPSIALLQKTVDLDRGENSDLRIKGRHDPCIVPRALPVVEAGLAICLMDAAQMDLSL